MKIFKHNLASSNRHGLSVIEVLTSIVVALIGVFGVLAMIPFSVKQTQAGLDQDAATSMARSALSSFEASGFKVVSANNQLNWVNAAGTQVPVASGIPLMCIDPLGIAENGAFGTFPFNCSITGVSELEMPTINLLRPDGSQFNQSDARRMFRLTDDLVFEESDDPTVADSDLLGPVQLFNESPAGGPLNRQSTGAVSWCAIAEPIVNDPNAEEVDSFKFYVLVFKDRVIDSDPTVEESRMAAAVVTSPNDSGLLSSVTIGVPLDSSIRRNDWVMLINRAPAVSATDPIARRTNMGFARISNMYGEDPDTPGYDPSSTTSSLTLDGPDFDFTNTTYIVHLRDVVAVFPRTIKLETVSSWNISD